MTQPITKKPLLALMMAIVPVFGIADGDVAQGQEKSQDCISCHGETGISISPQFPNIAGQHEDYLVQALIDYRDGGRNNAIMSANVANLSDQDIEDLAAYFASQEGLFTPEADD